MITVGTGKLFEQDHFAMFYDDQAHSMLNGHWDVDWGALMGESFTIDGKHYGYFGFTPAVPRMFLNLVFPQMFGKWTRFLMLVCIAFIIAALIQFIRLLQGNPSPSFIVVSILGAGPIFLCSHAITYHEAIITGTALAMWCYVCFLLYFRNARLRYLVAACLLMYFSCQARITSAAGAMIFASFLTMALLVRATGQFRGSSFGRLLDACRFPTPRQPVRDAAVIVAFVTAACGTYMAVNYAKFGTFLRPPYQFNEEYTKQRIAKIDGSMFDLSNVPFSLRAYFGYDRIQLNTSFPWLAMVSTGPEPGNGTKIDIIEPYASIPAASPALCFLAIIALALFFKKGGDLKPAALLIVIAAVAGSCITLAFRSISYRYTVDFYPLLVITALLGMIELDRLPSKVLRLSLKTVFILLGLWSIAANMAFAVSWQREGAWFDPAAKAELVRVRESVDSFFSNRTALIRYRSGDAVRSPHGGQFLAVEDSPGTQYRFDGKQWQLAAGRPLHVFDLVVRIQPGTVGQELPLWYAGRPGASDTVYLLYSSPLRFSLCFDHSGTGSVCGPGNDVVPNRDSRLHIDADRLNSTLTVLLDSQPVLKCPMELHTWTEQDVLFGESRGAIHGGKFPGEIRAVH